MDCNYFFRILNPEQKLSVVIDQYDQEGKILFASQDGERSDLTSKNLMNSYLKHPLMTFKIISAIHFEALRLWIKGIKIVKKKIKIKNNITAVIVWRIDCCNRFRLIFIIYYLLFLAYHLLFIMLYHLVFFNVIHGS